MKEIYLAAGCFWGAEKYLSLIPGVITTAVGYANGKTENPTYEEVCRHQTGHAETVHLTYDPTQISLTFLLDLFYDAIDPTSVNRQGNDIGTQYRSGIYYTDKEDKEIIEGSIILLGESYAKPIAIEVLPLDNFYPAETYHQHYLDKNPGGYCHLGSEMFKKAREAIDSTTLERTRGNDNLLKRLSPLQYEVTQNGATETPFANEYYDNFAEGIYVDIVNGQPLFVSTDKFESGCGWPSFSKPIAKEKLRELDDRSYGRLRTEIRAQDSNSHLGHVFEDGPAELGGLRYCINSAALRFIPKDEMEQEGFGYLIRLLDVNR